MKKIYLLFFMVLSGFLLSAQDWTTNASELYYISNGSKVFIEPDYSAMAVYFRERPAKNFGAQLEQKFQRAARGSEQIDHGIKTMDLKGMIQIKSVEGLPSIRTEQERASFLNNYDLKGQGAYKVLPAFRVDGIQAWLTKRVIIRLKDGVDLSQVEDLVQKNGGAFVKNLTDNNTFVFQIDEIKNQFELIHDINDRGLLDWGEPDFKMEIVRRNDPFYQYQWHLNNTGGTDLGGKALLNDADIDAPEAWAIATGNNVTVAVIDDGLENHEDLATLLPGYTPANNGNGTPSAAGDGHGQQCAGLIGALHNNIGVRGVSPDVDMFSVNIFAPNTTNADVAVGINWAVNNGADVLSNSWGFTSCTANISSITAAFNNAATNGRGGLGCIILVASGNDFNTCVSYPADLPSVTAVGGISGDGARSNFSNYGPALDIVAPSNDDWQFNAQGQLISTAHDLVTIDREGSAGWFSGNYSSGFGGTSGATPIAAGVAALVLSVDPSLTKAEVENILYSTADDIGPSGFDNEYGNGRVNAYQAVLAAGGSSCSLAAPSNFSASSIGNTSFNLSWNSVSGASSYTVSVNGSSSTVSGTSSSASGLSPGTSYVCTVVANCSGGGSGSASSINVTTTGSGSSVSDVLISSAFSTGFDGFTDGGTNAAWYGGSGFMSSAPFVYVRDNTNSSRITSPAFDASSYDQIYLEFDMQFYRMEGSDRLDVYFFDGSSWNNLGSVSVSDHGNGTTIAVATGINSSSFNLPSNARIRFEGEGSASSDYSFVDNVVITGNSGSAVVSSLSTSSLQASTNASLSFDGVGGEFLEGEISIFPNPTVDIVNINNLPLEAEVRLLDVSGKLLMKTNTSSIDLSERESGLYFIEVLSGGEEETKIKIIKQ